MSDSNIVENNPASNLDLTQYLPAEMLQEILKKLPIKDVVAFAKTSRYARYIVNDDKLWQCLVDRDFSDFDKKFFLNSIELASNYEKYKYLHTKKRQTLKKYRSKFDEIANNNLSEKNACLAIMLSFYPNAKDDIEYYKNNGATETEAQNLINNAKSDNPILYNYTSYFNAFLQINFDVQNNRIYDGINANKALPLIHVVSNKLKEHVDALIRAGADVFATDTDGDTAFCYTDNPELTVSLIKAVIKNGHLEKPIKSDGTTTLMLAAILGLDNEVETLLSSGANIFATNKNGNTAFFFFKDKPKIAKILIQAVIKTGKIEQPIDSKGTTALMFATQFGLKDEIAALLDAGADVFAKNYNGASALCYFNHNLEICKTLIQAIINTGNLDGSIVSNDTTALMYAAELGLKDEVTALLDAGANVFATNMDGNTAIACCNKDNPDIAKILIQAVINTGNLEQPIDHQGTTILMFATEFGLKDEVTTLLNAGANLFVTNQSGNTAFTYNNNLKIIIILIQALIKTGKLELPTDSVGTTALMLAAQYGLQNEVEALLTADANILTKNFYGGTVFCYYKGNPKILRTLIQAVIKTGKIEESLDPKGNTALMNAAVLGLSDEVSALLSADADVFAKNSEGNTAIFFSSNNKTIKILIDAAIRTGKVNTHIDHNKNTILIAAVCCGFYDVVKTILASGADIFAKNLDNKTAIFYCSIGNDDFRKAKKNKDILKIIARKVVMDGEEKRLVNDNGENLETIALKVLGNEEWNELLQDIKNTENEKTNPPLLTALNTLRNHNEETSDTANCNNALSERPYKNRRYH